MPRKVNKSVPASKAVRVSGGGSARKASKGRSSDATIPASARVALAQQLGRISLLNVIARAIAERQDLDSIFHVVTRQLEENLPVSHASVLLLDSEIDAFCVAVGGNKLKANASDVRMLVGATIPVVESGLHACVNGESVYVPDTVVVNAPYMQALARAGTRSLVAIPLIVDGTVLGAQVCTRQEQGAFRDEEIEFLRQLGEHISLAAHQIRLHRDLLKAFDDLRQTQQQVIQQERLQALGQMASGIAHDFNNALSPIAGFTDLLLNHPEMLNDKERVRDWLQVISTAAIDASNVVRRLREFYRRREENEVFLPVQLNQVIEQAISLTQPKWKDQAMASGLMIRVDMDLQEVPFISGSESELREALTNLIFNAVDAIPDEGTITIRTWSDGAYVNLSVSDTGVGMTEGVRDLCFDPFFSTKGEHGTGMGLSMVFGTVTRHEGQVDVDSTEGKGTTFTIRFPGGKSQDNVGASDSPEDAFVPIRALHILLVDDEPRVLAVTREMLRLNGHTVEIAIDGRDAMRRYEAGRFDIVITDRSMPEMSGDQLADVIKQISPDQRIIMMTGFGEIMATTGETVPGVDFILPKPVRLQPLRKAIASVTDHGNDDELQQSEGCAPDDASTPERACLNHTILSPNREFTTGTMRGDETAETGTIPVDSSMELESGQSAQRGEAGRTFASSVLIIDDDESICNSLQRLLESSGFVVLAVNSGERAIEIVADFSPDVMLVDYRLPGGMDGAAAIVALQSIVPDAVPIMITGYPDLSTATQAIRHSAFDFLCKPIRGLELELSVRRAVAHHEAKQSTRVLQAQEAMLQAGKMLSARCAHLIGNQVFVARGALRPLRKLDNVEASEAVRELEECSDKIRRIVEELHRFGRIGQIELRHVQIEQLFKDVVRHHSGLAPNVGWNVSMGDDLPTCLLDPEQIHHALGELLQNAIHHTHQGGEIRISIVTEQGSSGTGRKIHIEVENTGPGISPENRMRIFEPFFSTRPDGTGLGLAIVHQIITSHGGVITETGNPGRCAKFEIDLPAS